MNKQRIASLSFLCGIMTVLGIFLLFEGIVQIMDKNYYIAIFLHLLTIYILFRNYISLKEIQKDIRNIKTKRGKK